MKKSLIIPFMNLAFDEKSGTKTFLFNHGLEKETLILNDAFDNALLTFFFQGSLILGFKNSLAFANEICFNNATFEDSDKANNFQIPNIENINIFNQWQNLFATATEKQKKHFVEQTLFTFGFNDLFNDMTFATGKEGNILQKMEDGITLLPIMSNEKDHLLFYAFDKNTYCSLEKSQFFGTIQKEISLSNYQKMVDDNEEHLNFAKEKIQKAIDKAAAKKKLAAEKEEKEFLKKSKAEKKELEKTEKETAEKTAKIEKDRKILIITKAINIAPTLTDLEKIPNIYKDDKDTKFTLKDFQNFGKLIREKKATFAPAATNENKELEKEPLPKATEKKPKNSIKNAKKEKSEKTAKIENLELA